MQVEKIGWEFQRSKHKNTQRRLTLVHNLAPPGEEEEIFLQKHKQKDAKLWKDWEKPPSNDQRKTNQEFLKKETQNTQLMKAKAGMPMKQA